MVRSVSMDGGYNCVCCVVYPLYFSMCVKYSISKIPSREPGTWHAQKLLAERVSGWEMAAKRPESTQVNSPCGLLSSPWGGGQWVCGHRVKASLQQQWDSRAKLSRFWGKMVFNWEFCMRVNLPFKCESTIKTLSGMEGFRKYAIQAPSLEK